MIKNIDSFTYRGKEIKDLPTEELYKIIVELYNESERFRKLYYESQDDIINMMDDEIKLKFKN